MAARQGRFHEAATLELCKPLLQAVLDALDVTKLVAKEKDVASTSRPLTTYGLGYGYYQSLSQPPAKLEFRIKSDLLAKCFRA
jgi:hypothetical protein